MQFFGIIEGKTINENQTKSGVDRRTSKVLSTEQVTDIRGGHSLTMQPMSRWIQYKVNWQLSAIVYITIQISYLFLFCTEVIADDTKAIDAVVNADKKRLALIEERKKLEAEKGKRGEDHGERLKEVLIHLI